MPATGVFIPSVRRPKVEHTSSDRDRGRRVYNPRGQPHDDRPPDGSPPQALPDTPLDEEIANRICETGTVIAK